MGDERGIQGYRAQDAYVYQQDSHHSMRSVLRANTQVRPYMPSTIDNGSPTQVPTAYSLPINCLPSEFRIPKQG